MRSGIKVFTALCILLVGGLGVHHASAAPAAKTPVKYVDMVDTSTGYAYKPVKITVKVGTKVTWRNKSSAGHTVTDKHTPARFDSNVNKLIEPKHSWSFTFKKAGTYTYWCLIHPNMIAKVVVKK